LGGDLDGCDELPSGFDGVQSYPAMAQRLLDRGVSENIVEDIFWNNALGVMKRAVHNHTR
jgi:microsomal dipeptidase-like Zn-dependent dipeptidase